MKNQMKARKNQNLTDKEPSDPVGLSKLLFEPQNSAPDFPSTKHSLTATLVQSTAIPPF